jgi:hypothetical protein
MMAEVEGGGGKFSKGEMETTRRPHSFSQRAKDLLTTTSKSGVISRVTPSEAKGERKKETVKRQETVTFEIKRIVLTLSPFKAFDCECSDEEAVQEIVEENGRK